MLSKLMQLCCYGIVITLSAWGISYGQSDKLYLTMWIMAILLAVSDSIYALFMIYVCRIGIKDPMVILD